jgi:hypothetical protein
MSTPVVKSLIDEQIESLDGVLLRPRETLVCELKCSVKGDWRCQHRDNHAFMEGDWGCDPRGRMVEL